MEKKKIFQIALGVLAVVLVGCLILALAGRGNRGGTEVSNAGTSQTTAGTDETGDMVGDGDGEAGPDNTTEGGGTAGGSNPASPGDTVIDISIDVEDRTEEPDNTVNGNTNQEDPSYGDGEKEDGVIDFKDLLNIGNAGD